jgi:hypothetical protein
MRAAKQEGQTSQSIPKTIRAITSKGQPWFADVQISAEYPKKTLVPPRGKDTDMSKNVPDLSLKCPSIEPNKQMFVHAAHNQRRGDLERSKEDTEP